MLCCLQTRSHSSPFSIAGFLIKCNNYVQVFLGKVSIALLPATITALEIHELSQCCNHIAGEAAWKAVTTQLCAPCSTPVPLLVPSAAQGRSAVAQAAHRAVLTALQLLWGSLCGQVGLL